MWLLSAVRGSPKTAPVASGAVSRGESRAQRVPGMSSCLGPALAEQRGQGQDSMYPAVLYAN